MEHSRSINNRFAPAIRALVTHPLFFLAIRLIVGGVFLLFGFSKAIAPIEEFISVIKTYQLLPEAVVPAAAIIFIIAEISAGLFFIVGIFTQRAAQLTAVLLTLFIIALSQALLRGIGLEDCGCSGGLFSIGETPQAVLVRDLIMLAAVWWFLKRNPQEFTIDRWLKTR